MPTLGEIKLILIALAFIGSAGLSAIVTHKIDAAALLRVENQYQQAQITAGVAAAKEQANLDKIGSDADKATIAQTQSLLDAANARIAAIPKHVTRGAHNCITWGLAATIDATALDADVDTMALPPGKKWGDCANLNAEHLAEIVAGNYARDDRNTARLKAAQAYINSIAGVKR